MHCTTLLLSWLSKRTSSSSVGTARNCPQDKSSPWECFPLGLRVLGLLENMLNKLVWRPNKLWGFFGVGFFLFWFGFVFIATLPNSSEFGKISSLFLTCNWWMEKVKWGKENVFFSWSGKKLEEERDSFVSVQTTGREELSREQVHEKKVSRSECHFCNRTVLYFLAQCNFSIILWFCTFSCAKCIAGIHLLSIDFCCILWKFNLLTIRFHAASGVLLNNGRIWYFWRTELFDTYIL